MLEIERWVAIGFTPLEIKTHVLNMFSVLEIYSPTGVKYLLDHVTAVFCEDAFLSIPFASVYLLSLSLPLQNIYFGHVKTNFGFQFTRVSVLTKKWKALTVVKETELLVVGDSQNQI